MAAPSDITQNTSTLVETESLDALGRWDWSDFTGSNWDKYWPYQLSILQVDDNGGKPSYSTYRGLTFTLPYSPESMQVAMPFAISVQATQDGIVEQHGGVPFRSIVFSGSFGVYINRPMAEANPGAIAGIAGGQLSGLGSANAAQQTVNAVKGLVGLSTPSNLIRTEDVSPMLTGYWQCLQLRKFLEAYAEVKKTKLGPKLRLALVQWKDQSAWLVTPQRFEVIRQAPAPFEYKYMLQFQAWRRINPNNIKSLGRGGAPSYVSNDKRKSSALQVALTKLDQSRKVLDKASATMGAIRADVEKVMGTLRTAALSVKAAVGVGRTAYDLPRAVGTTIARSVYESWDILKASFAQNKDPKVAQVIASIDLEANRLAAGAPGIIPPTLVGVLGGSDPTSSAFKALVDMSSVRLTAAQQDLVDAETQKAANLTLEDWKSMRDGLLDFMASYSDQVGLSSAAYDVAQGRSRTAQIRQVSNDDLRVLHSLGSAVQAIDLIIGNAPAGQAPTVVEYVAGLANANGIEMRVPRSKFVVPFPYGGSLEKLAQQYLGDAGRWMEIAELNELRAPYVDEVGTQVPLLVNGQGNTIVIADASKLLVGQLVYLFSTTVTAERRHVANVQMAGAGENYVVTLDGEGDMAKFKAEDRAGIQFYQPGTVNCQQVIFIPSDREADQDILKYLPSADDFERILDKGEVDGMLTEGGDLVVTPDGDWPFVLGYANLVQWARVALNTRLGSMPLHPNFGLNGQVGESLAESSLAKAILDEVKSTLAYHPSFLGVRSASITLNGPSLALGLELAVRGSDALLPITFDISMDVPR